MPVGRLLLFGEDCEHAWEAQLNLDLGKMGGTTPNLPARETWSRRLIAFVGQAA
jgi:hypothetical protein